MKKVCRNSIAKGYNRASQALYDRAVSIFRRDLDRMARAIATSEVTPEDVAQAVDSLRKSSLQ